MEITLVAKENQPVQPHQVCSLIATKNDELLKYVACLQKSPLNKGKDIADVKKKSKTLKTIF